MSFFSRLFGNDPETQVRKAAEKLQRKEAEARENEAKTAALLKRATGGDPDGLSYAARSKAAIALVITGQTRAGIEAWRSIADDFPDERGSALQQVGACYHLQKAWPEALASYQAAIDAGFPAEDIEDSIAEIKAVM